MDIFIDRAVLFVRRKFMVQQGTDNIVHKIFDFTNVIGYNDAEDKV